MPTLLPWAGIQAYDLDVLVSIVPCLFVYTWYVDGEPESAVTRFWQDEDARRIQHELLLSAPVTYEEAISWAQELAAVTNIKRIHVWDATTEATGRRAKKRVQSDSRIRLASLKSHPAVSGNAKTTGTRCRWPSRIASKA